MEPVPKKLHELSEDVRSFYSCSHIKRMHRPTALEFMREAVSAHQPVIIEGLLDEWPAMRTWASTDSFLAACPARVNVNFTPDGRADSVQKAPAQEALSPESAWTAPGDAADASNANKSHASVFAEPLEMSISTLLFMSMLDTPNESDAVPYLSAQNDNLRLQMPDLLQDVAESLPLADECFGMSPEAVNLWVGDERSVSSTHKDFFENMYCVIRGVKTFTLFPPTDVAFLPSGTYPRYTYARAAGDSTADGATQLRPQKAQLKLVPVPVHGEEERALRTTIHDDLCQGQGQGQGQGLPDEEEVQRSTSVASQAGGVQWIWLDPEDPVAAAQHPPYSLASPLRIEVQAGEVLYLPAMWLHRVSQTCVSIAVNFWYDMRFDLRYVLMQTCQRLAAEAAEESSAGAGGGAGGGASGDGQREKEVTL